MDILNEGFSVLVADPVKKNEIEIFKFEERKKNLEALRQDSRLTEVKSGPLYEHSIKVREKLVERNKKLGVDTPDHTPAIFVASNKWFSENGINPLTIGGKTDPESGSVIISTFDSFIYSDSNWVHDYVLFNQMIVLGHELYHDSAPVNYVISHSDDYLIEKWRTGLSYNHKNKKSEAYQSLEEGMATIWESEVKKIAINYFDRDPGRIGNQGYPKSKELCEYLIKAVPNFESLVEKARIEGNVDKLATVVDDVFGLKTFNELTYITEKDAESYLERLKNKQK